MAAIPISPRPNMPRYRSGSLEQSRLEHERQLCKWRDQILTQGASELENYRDFQDAERLIDYISGNVWDANRPAYRSKFYDNQIADQRREALAALSDIRPTLDIGCKVPAYKHDGEIANGYVRHLWDSEDLDLKLVRWLDHALFGTGFMKHTAYAPGCFNFMACGLDHAFPILMEEDDVQSAAAFVYRAYKSLSYFIDAFGAEKCKGLEHESVAISRNLGSQQGQYTRPNSIPEYSWSAMSPAMKRRMAMRNGPTRQAAGTHTPFPILELIEIYSDDWTLNEFGKDVIVQHPDLPLEDHNYHYIVEPGRRLFPRKRLTVFAGDRVMYDGPSPFWHGQYPFTMLQLNPCVWSPGGISKYRDLIPLARSLSRIGAGVDECVVRALNGTFLTKRGAIPEAVWDAFQPGKPGQKIILNPIANPMTDFREMTSPALPPQVDMWMRFLVDSIKRRSGSVDIQGLSKKKQAPGGDTIAQMQEAQSGPFRLEGRYTEAALKRCGAQMISNIFQYTSCENRMEVLGGEGMSQQDFDWYSDSMVPAAAPREDHWKKFPMNIKQGSMHGNAKFITKQTALLLSREGKLSMEGLYEVLEFPLNVEIEKNRLAQEHQQGIGVAPPKGRTARTSRGQRNGSPI
jgi:hypothetical protein